MSSRLAGLRSLTRKIGVDFSRWPAQQIGWDRTTLVHHAGVDLILDVGANDGGYGQELRRFGYRGRIISFEPLDGPRAQLIQRADPDWQVLEWALGARNETLTINVAANDGASSSFLDMLPRHVESAPQAQYVSRQAVHVRTLNDLWPMLQGTSVRPFLKIDVQGFENEVLQGADRVLKQLAGIKLELSLVPLYAGAPEWRSLLDALLDAGFELARLDPGFCDKRTGQMLQVDATIVRPKFLA